MPKQRSHVCTECGTDYPRTLTYYYKQPSPTDPDRLRPACKACHRARQKRDYTAAFIGSDAESHKRVLRRKAWQRAYYKENRMRRCAYQKAYRAKKKAEREG